VENGIETEFPQECLSQANGFGADMEFELGDRRDFRDQLVFTVDGETAKDFDDALHFVDHGDFIEVGVHIADVSHFVPPGSPLDQWAAAQGNSTYLPHKAIPMLPEALSTNLCSLNPDVPRYTLSAVIHFSRDGQIRSYRFFKGLIQSSHRLTYTQVDALAVEKNEEDRNQYPENLLKALDLSIELSRAMHKKRHAEGGLAIEMIDPRIQLDKDQNITGIQLFLQSDANRMIEAFMCATNECVARFFDDQGITIPYRIHDAPDPEKLEQLSAFLATFEVEIPPDIVESPGRGLNKLIQAVKDAPNAQVLQTQILKSMKMAEYSTDNHGHFGLASTDYAHFTSPIRRYADLVIHQRLSRILSDPKITPEQFDDTLLNDICRHISTKERDSAKAEQSFVQLKMLRHLEDEVGGEFGGVISEVKPFGLFILLHKYQTSGLVHIEELGDDYYEFIPEQLALVGESRGKVYKVGLEVTVVLTRVDFLQRKIDLTFAHDWAARKQRARSGGAGGRGLRRPKSASPRGQKNDPRSRFNKIARSSGKSRAGGFKKGGKGRKR
jgi:ribonuclease R